jgi:hypothetical protein
MRDAKPPAAPGWVHEIKHDSYRLIVRRDGDTVRHGHAGVFIIVASAVLRNALVDITSSQA